MWLLRRESFLTLDITPGFILLDMAQVFTSVRPRKWPVSPWTRFAFIKGSDSSRVQVAAWPGIACLTKSRFAISHLCDMPRHLGSL